MSGFSDDSCDDLELIHISNHMEKHKLKRRRLFQDDDEKEEKLLPKPTESNLEKIVPIPKVCSDISTKISGSEPKDVEPKITPVTKRSTEMPATPQKTNGKVNNDDEMLDSEPEIPATRPLPLPEIMNKIPPRAPPCSPLLIKNTSCDGPTLEGLTQLPVSDDGDDENADENVDENSISFNPIRESLLGKVKHSTPTQDAQSWNLPKRAENQSFSTTLDSLCDSMEPASYLSVKELYKMLISSVVDISFDGKPRSPEFFLGNLLIMAVEGVQKNIVKSHNVLLQGSPGSYKTTLLSLFFENEFADFHSSGAPDLTFFDACSSDKVVSVVENCNWPFFSNPQVMETMMNLYHSGVTLSGPKYFAPRSFFLTSSTPWAMDAIQAPFVRGYAERRFVYAKMKPPPSMHDRPLIIGSDNRHRLLLELIETFEFPKVNDVFVESDSSANAIYQSLDRMQELLAGDDSMMK